MPLASSGLYAWAIISAHAVVGLLVLASLLRWCSLVCEIGWWRPVACFAIYEWVAFLLPLGMWRLHYYLHEQWDLYLRFLMPHSADPVGATNAVPYVLYTALGTVIVRLLWCDD
jgi:hypothetical protein